MQNRTRQWIERPDDMTRLINLEYPIPLGADGDSSGLVAQLTMKRPKVRDILETSRLAATEDERRIQAVARMTGQLPSLIEELYACDWERLNDAYDELRFPKPSGVTSGGSLPLSQEV
ncbi:MAG: phage tail assembly protein [Desulfobacter sp.]